MIPFGYASDNKSGIRGAMPPGLRSLRNPLPGGSEPPRQSATFARPVADIGRLRSIPAGISDLIGTPPAVAWPPGPRDRPGGGPKRPAAVPIGQMGGKRAGAVRPSERRGRDGAIRTDAEGSGACLARSFWVRGHEIQRKNSTMNKDGIFSVLRRRPKTCSPPRSQYDSGSRVTSPPSWGDSSLPVANFFYAWFISCLG